MEKLRKIIHVDMDAFYASVEQRENPNHNGKPLVVGGISERSVVAAASYEARKYGIHSAMPIKTALKKYEKLIIVKPNFELYKKISTQIRKIFHEYTDLVEPLSLDEAFLDVTQNKSHLKFATQIAKEIKMKIWKETQLTASAGISYNKFLAKTASDINKPNGMYTILPEKAIQFINQLPIYKFFGIGKVTALKMQKMGIFTGKDLKEKELSFLVRNFGKVGYYYFNIARGQDERPVNPNRIRKSVGVENTYEKDLFNLSEILLKIEELTITLYSRLEKNSFWGKTLTLKIKFNDFSQVSKSRTISQTYNSKKIILATATQLINEINLNKKQIRLLGLTVSNEFAAFDNQQLDLNFNPG